MVVGHNNVSAPIMRGDIRFGGGSALPAMGCHHPTVHNSYFIVLTTVPVTNLKRSCLEMNIRVAHNMGQVNVLGIFQPAVRLLDLARV